ncbi:MAG: hypothetical protein WAM09_16980 [Anaerolineales bacterium]
MFCQWGSQPPGHPEYGLPPRVEETTGPLGQDYGNGVGAVRGLWSYIDDNGKRRDLHEPTRRMIKDLEKIPCRVKS